jgi:hypothetical protein
MLILFHVSVNRNFFLGSFGTIKAFLKYLVFYLYIFSRNVDKQLRLKVFAVGSIYASENSIDQYNEFCLLTL